MAVWLRWVHFEARPSSTWVTLLDHSVILALCLVFSYRSAPFATPYSLSSSHSLVRTQGTSIFAILLCLYAAWSHWKWRPYAGPTLVWKHYTKIFSYLLAALATLTNLLEWHAQSAALDSRSLPSYNSAAAASATKPLVSGGASLLAVAARYLFIIVAALTVLLCVILVCIAVWGAATEVGLTAPPLFLLEPPPSTTTSGKTKKNSGKSGKGKAAAGGGKSSKEKEEPATALLTPTSQVWMRSIQNPLSMSSSSEGMAEGGTNNAIIQGLPLKMLHSLESRGVVIQASGRILLTAEGTKSPLSPYESALAEELSLLVRQGHALPGGVLYDARMPPEGSSDSSAVNPPPPHPLLPSTLNLAGNRVNWEGKVIPLPKVLPFAIPPPAAPLPSSSQGGGAQLSAPTPNNKLQSYAPPQATPSPPPSLLHPTLSPPLSTGSARAQAPPLDGGIPCLERVIEGGQVLYLDGPSGPALAPGWQRFSSSSSSGGGSGSGEKTEWWYVCVVPPYLTETPPQPQWDPPYAPVPPLHSLPLPFHPRIDPDEKSLVGEDGVKYYYDPRSGSLLQKGWRAVTDGVDTWFGNSQVEGGVWKAPILSKSKRRSLQPAHADVERE